MDREERAIRTFSKNAKVLFGAIDSKKINPQSFTASDLGLSGSGCKCLMNWGMIIVVDHIMSFIPIDEDCGFYRKILINVYKVSGSKETATTYIQSYCNRETTRNLAQIGQLLQQNHNIQKIAEEWSE